MHVCFRDIRPGGAESARSDWMTLSTSFRGYTDGFFFFFESLVLSHNSLVSATPPLPAATPAPLSFFSHRPRHGTCERILRRRYELLAPLVFRTYNQDLFAPMTESDSARPCIIWRTMLDVAFIFGLGGIILPVTSAVAAGCILVKHES